MREIQLSFSAIIIHMIFKNEHLRQVA